MARLIYASNMSLDGCTEDERGALDWNPPDEVFVFITGLMRSADTYLYGRHMYDTMAVWETDSTLAALSELTADFASAWQAAEKVVYSSTLAAPSGPRHRSDVERSRKSSVAFRRHRPMRWATARRNWRYSRPAPGPGPLTNRG